MFLFSTYSMVPRCSDPPSCPSLLHPDLVFLFRAGRFFIADHPQINKSEIHFAFECCSYVCGGTSFTSLSFLDRLQRNVIQVIDNPSLTSGLQSLAHRQLVALLFLFYRYFWFLFFVAYRSSSSSCRGFFSFLCTCG